MAVDRERDGESESRGERVERDQEEKKRREKRRDKSLARGETKWRRTVEDRAERRPRGRGRWREGEGREEMARGLRERATKRTEHGWDAKRGPR